MGVMVPQQANVQPHAVAPAQGNVNRALAYAMPRRPPQPGAYQNIEQGNAYQSRAQAAPVAPQNPYATPAGLQAAHQRGQAMRAAQAVPAQPSTVQPQANAYQSAAQSAPSQGSLNAPAPAGMAANIANQNAARRAMLGQR